MNFRIKKADKFERTRAVFKMRKLDLYWTTNPDWWYRDENGVRHVKEDAPEEVKKSYEHYLEQQREHEEFLKKYAFMAYV